VNFSLQTSSGYLSMTKWSRAENIGFDGVKLSTPYPDSNKTNYSWYKGSTGEGRRYANYVRHFHRYLREAPESDINSDVELILKARNQAFTLQQTTYMGECADMEAAPGAICNVYHFNGVNDANVIVSLITETTLTMRLVWPSAISIIPTDVKPESLSISITAVRFDDDLDEKRYTGVYNG
jgi:hypothetical protein